MQPESCLSESNQTTKYFEVGQLLYMQVQIANYLLDTP